MSLSTVTLPPVSTLSGSLPSLPSLPVPLELGHIPPPQTSPVNLELGGESEETNSPPQSSPVNLAQPSNNQDNWANQYVIDGLFYQNLAHCSVTNQILQFCLSNFLGTTTTYSCHKDNEKFSFAFSRQGRAEGTEIMKIVEWFKIEFLLNFLNIVKKAKIFSNQALYTWNVTKIIIIKYKELLFYNFRLQLLI